MAARAAASERLSDAIIASLTSGLLVVDLEGRVPIVNPAGCRLLDLPGPVADGVPYRQLLAHVAPLGAVIDECLASRHAIVRRALEVERQERPMHLGVTASPLYDDHGAPAGAICLFTDLTAVRELEDQIPPEGEPGARRRADRRPGARVPQRPRDDPRLQPAHGPRRPARGVPALHAGDPRRDGRAGAGGHQLPGLRPSDHAHADARRPAGDCRARRRGRAGRLPRARRRRRRPRHVSDRRRRRSAAAAGVREPAAQCRRVVRGHRRSRRGSSSSRRSSPAGKRSVSP